MELTEIERVLLAEVAEQRGCVRASRLYGPERSAANRLVGKEALYVVNYANGPHYEITDAGRAALATKSNT